MRRIVGTFLLALLQFSGHSQTPYVVSGTIKGAGNKMVYLAEDVFYKTTKRRDSTLAGPDGSFVFKGVRTEPLQLGLAVKGTGVMKNRFIIDGPLTTISGSIDSLAGIRIAGSKENVLFTSLLKGFNFQERMDELARLKRRATLKKDTAEVHRLADLEYRMLAFEVRDSLRTFIGKNLGTLTSLFALAQIHDSLLPAEYKELLDKEKAAGAGTYSLFSYLMNEIRMKETIVEGTMAPEFTDKDLDGGQVALSSFKGKYVLLDFWASWCEPCREDNPKLVRIFNALKTKAFTIVSISLDTDKNSWKKAISDDKLLWTHLSDLKGFDEHTARLYGVYEVPRNFLIDPSGKIIAKDLHGDSLKDKLTELGIK